MGIFYYEWWHCNPHHAPGYVELSFMDYQWVDIMSLGQDTRISCMCGGVHVQDVIPVGV